MRLAVVAVALSVVGCSFSSRVPVDETGFTTVACTSPLDCPQGLTCSILAGRCFDPQRLGLDAGVSDLPCEAQGDCVKPLSCALGLSRCVAVESVAVAGGITPVPCSASLGCPSPLACAIGLGACVSADSVNVDAGVTALPCTVGGDCPRPFTCALGLSRCVAPEEVPLDGGLSSLPCVASFECPAPLSCAVGLGRCISSAAVTLDAGVSNLPCVRASDCPGQLTCASGLGRCVSTSAVALDGGLSSLPCTGAGDCPGTLTCARSLGTCVDSRSLSFDDAGVSLVPCQRTDDCPSPFVCSTLLRCADATVLELPAFQSVTLEDASGAARVRFGGLAPNDSGVVKVVLSRQAATVVARFRNTSLTCTATGPLTWECPFRVSAPSSSEVLEVSALDLRGVGVTERVPLVVDVDPPRLVASTVAFAIVASPSNPRASLGPAFAPTALRGDSQLQVTLLVDDPNTTLVTLRYQASGTAVTLLNRSGQAFTFRAVVPAAEPEGPVRLALDAEDDLGNATTGQTIDATIVIDRQAPGAPDVTTDRGVLVERVPFGDGTRQGTYASMPMTPPGLLLLRDAAGGSVLHVAQGAAPFTALVSALDLERLSAEVVDEAGNSSSTVEVKRYRLTLTPGGAGNPSIVATSPVVTAPASPLRAVAAGDSLSAIDTRTADVVALPSWQPWVLLSQQPNPGTHLSLIEDVPRGRLLRITQTMMGQTSTTDIAGGKLIEASLPFTSAVSGACSTDARHCLVFSNSPTFGTPHDLWLLDDSGARLLRSIRTSGTGSVTWSPRTQTYFLGIGSTLFELDATGTELRSFTVSMRMATEVAATPRGVIIAGQGGAPQMLLYDGGMAAASSLMATTLVYDRDADRTYAASFGLLTVMETNMPAPQLAGSNGICANCTPFAFDPLLRRLVAIDGLEFAGFDGGSFNPPLLNPNQVAALPAAAGRASMSAGVSVTNYDETFGWRPRSNMTMSACSLPPVPSAGVVVDGGLVLPCNGAPSFVATSSPSAMALGPQSEYIAALPAGRLLFRDGTWSEATGFRPHLSLPTNPGTPAAALDAGQALAVRPGGLTLYSALPDGGWNATVNGFMANTQSLVSAVFATSSPAHVFIVSTPNSALPQGLGLYRLTNWAGPLPAQLSSASPWAPNGIPALRNQAYSVPLGNDSHFFGGNPAPPVAQDLWRLNLKNRATVNWRLVASTVRLPTERVVRTTVVANAQALADGGLPLPFDVMAWDAWGAKWRPVASSLDGGQTTGVSTVELTPVIELSVQQQPSFDGELRVDRVQAQFDYVLP